MRPDQKVHLCHWAKPTQSKDHRPACPNLACQWEGRPWYPILKATYALKVDGLWTRRAGEAAIPWHDSRKAMNSSAISAEEWAWATNIKQAELKRPILVTKDQRKFLPDGAWIGSNKKGQTQRSCLKRLACSDQQEQVYNNIRLQEYSGNGG